MTPIQQLYLGVGAKKKTYLDDVFSTYVYEGTGSARSINNGINLSGEGGMTWIKSREETDWHHIVDTVRGAGKTVWSNENNAEITDTNRLSSFNTNGFSLGTDYRVNKDDTDFSSWTFRKAPGFFDVVTYTGNGTAGRTISHNLGCVPGLIMVKCTSDASTNWRVYHRSVGSTHALQLDGTNAASDNIAFWNDTPPTSTHFSVGTSIYINGGSSTYVAYLFAGGESTAATARSVDFDGSSAEVHLSMSASTDLDMGTGDFTIEFWYKGNGYNNSYRQGIIASNRTWQSGFTQIQVNHPSHQNHIILWDYDIDSSNPVLKSTNTFPQNGTWRHVAISRSGSTLRMFVNGSLEKSATQTGSLDFSDSYGTLIGYNPTDIGYVGSISNLRVVKGTAVYTSSFNPPTAPLTNITNTKLLCCNNSHVAGKTVGPALTVTGSPTASTDSPFDDPAGFVFGDAEDQNVIKCGSYTGNGSTDGPEINLGFEPQWVLIKWTAEVSGNHEGWVLVDSMRGIVSGGNDTYLMPNNTSVDSSSSDVLDLTPTGFKIKDQYDYVNNNGTSYIYLAIRRPDLYVGKPVQTATSVFALDTGNSSETIPVWDSGFPVDFGIMKTHGSTASFYASSRLTQGKYLLTDTTAAESSGSGLYFDSNEGYGRKGNTYSWGTNKMAWMWKRGAGFDVVAFQGTATNPGPSYRHSLGKVPELKIIKRRNASTDWFVTGTAVSQSVGGNNNSKDYFIKLNATDAATTFSNYWDGGNDTSTHFTVRHGNGAAGGSADPYLCLLFASVDGISKVGNYTGTGSNRSISFGFQPRFMITRRVSSSGYGWYVLDTLRGWSSGNDPYLDLSSNSAEGSSEFGTPTSTGFDIVGGAGHLNENGAEYIYYAHA